MVRAFSPPLSLLLSSPLPPSLFGPLETLWFARAPSALPLWHLSAWPRCLFSASPSPLGVEICAHSGAIREINIVCASRRPPTPFKKSICEGLVLVLEWCLSSVSPVMEWCCSGAVVVLVVEWCCIGVLESSSSAAAAAAAASSSSSAVSAAARKPTGVFIYRTECSLQGRCVRKSVSRIICEQKDAKGGSEGTQGEGPGEYARAVSTALAVRQSGKMAQRGWGVRHGSAPPDKQGGAPYLFASRIPPGRVIFVW